MTCCILSDKIQLAFNAKVVFSIASVLSRMQGKQTYPEYSKGDNIIYRVRLQPGNIGYFSGTVEAYDGIGFVRTVDARQGVVEIWTPPDHKEAMDRLLAAMDKEFPIEILQDS